MTLLTPAIIQASGFRMTEEQEDICNTIETSGDSLMTDALAGTGKTKSIELASAKIKRPGLALAFNVKIKKELEPRLPPNFQAMTLNGLGHKAWSKAIGKFCKVEDRKLGNLINEVAKGLGFNDLIPDDWDAVRRAVTGAMQAGLVPDKYPHKGLIPDTPESWAGFFDEMEPQENLMLLARAVLIASIAQGFEGIISFDDQIYLSTMFNGVFQRFPEVLVDEAQDLSPLNHIQLKRCAADRIAVFGDPRQAIYAFRGADSMSMTNLAKLRSSWQNKTLSITFRCPKLIVARQWHHAPGYRAHENNPEGEYYNLTRREWKWEDIAAKAKGDIFILCRNNAPLLSMAFKLLRQQVPVAMLGRDIGKNLVTLSKKIMPDAAMPAADCVKAIRDWEEREISLAKANNRDNKVEGITDRAECLVAVLEGSGVSDAGAFRRALETLFAKDNARVVLGTGHRAKGLERRTVVHLDPWRIPSKWAKAAAENGDPGPLRQETNLRYVLETRAQEVFIEASLQDFVGDYS